MQAQPGKQAPDRQALQGLAGAQLALNSFLAKLVGGPPKVWPRSLLYSAPCFSPSQGSWVGGEECGNFEPLYNLRQGPALPGPPEFGITEICIPTHLHLFLALGPWICDSSALRKGIRPSVLHLQLHSPENLGN